MPTIPIRLEAKDLRDYAQLDLRFELSKLTHQVSVFTEGVLVMEKTLLGVVQVDPRQILQEVSNDIRIGLLLFPVVIVVRSVEHGTMSVVVSLFQIILNMSSCVLPSTLETVSITNTTMKDVQSIPLIDLNLIND
jgi:hypothetical protein